MFLLLLFSVSHLFLDEADQATDSENEHETSRESCILREVLLPGAFVHVLFVVDTVSYSDADAGADSNEPNSELDAGQLNCRVIVM